MQTEQILNCVSEETAYTLSRFPFNFGILCQARYWVDTNRTYGQRIFSQYSRDPEGKEWYTAKSSGYYDIVILTKRTDPSDPYCGHLVQHAIKFDTLPFGSLVQLAGFYVFTPYQKERIMKAFADRKIAEYQFSWQDDSLLDHTLIQAAEGVSKKPGKPKAKMTFVERKAKWIDDGMVGPMPVQQPGEQYK